MSISVDQALTLRHFIQELSQDTDELRLNYIFAQLIELSREMYPQPELVRYRRAA